VDARIREGGDFKNHDLHRLIFEAVGTALLYAAMAAGLPDLVDCAQLAEKSALCDGIMSWANCAAPDLLRIPGHAECDFCICKIGIGKTGSPGVDRSISATGGSAACKGSAWG